MGIYTNPCLKQYATSCTEFLTPDFLMAFFLCDMIVSVEKFAFSAISFAVNPCVSSVITSNSRSAKKKCGGPIDFWCICEHIYAKKGWFSIETGE